MALSTGLHSILDKYEGKEYDLEAIGQYLMQNPSSINRVRNEYQPLHRVLRSRFCTRELVKLLLDYGADVNPSQNCTKSQLESALMYLYDTPTLRMLLERGADVDRILDNNCSLLSFALHQRNCNVEELQMLLDFAKSPKGWCQRHKSLFQCYVSENLHIHEIVRLLLLRRFPDEGGQQPSQPSALCHVLLTRKNYETSFLKEVLSMGPSMSKCNRHLSPLHCYVHSKQHLLEDDVKLLLELGTDFKNVSADGDTVLHTILRDRTYEMATLKVLLESKDVDVNLLNASGSCLLMCALSNSHRFMEDAVLLLMDKGAKLYRVDERSWGILHYAVRQQHCSIDLLKKLIYSGSLVNVRNTMGLTPFEFALNQRCNSPVIKLFLAVGARLPDPIWPRLSEMSSIIKDNRRAFRDLADCLELLLRYAVLGNMPFYHVGYVVQEDRSLGLFVPFMKACMDERDRLGVTFIFKVFSLLEFAICYPCARLDSRRRYDFNALLRVLAKNSFPIYFEIISTKVKRSDMEIKLEEVIKNVKLSSPDPNYVDSEEMVVGVYDLSCIQSNETAFECDPTCAGSKVVDLNKHCTLHIASFLPDHDLLNFIIALIPDSHWK